VAAQDHWHPVLPSKKLRKQPVGIRLLGSSIVLFRAKDGQVGALEDCCPHRRMRMSLGKVVNERLQCPYHGWTFDCQGVGESPGTPKLHASVPHWDVVERFGAIWVKPEGSEPKFPTFEVDGYFHLCTLHHQAKAPLEVVLDNFTEIEHTPTTHGVFGYPLERMHEVEVNFVPTDSSVRVINVGPTKPVPLFLRVLLQIRNSYHFNDDWTTHFSPVYSVYDHWWTNRETGREGMVRWRLYIFFTPINDQETSVVTFGFTKSRYRGPAGGVRLFKWWAIRILDRELRADMEILGNLADKEPTMNGMKLSRFDRVLGLNRERIETIYRGPTSSLNGNNGNFECLNLTREVIHQNQKASITKNQSCNS
jgi:phenylpropionate dioxygenase-like ring-hydroxylating dioxygenase large terminal subunit